MPVLHILSLALTVACLAGVNLYLTVFLAGLAGHAGELEVIGVLGHPAVMTVAALLYLLEAVVDKIPAMDSLWDALHTVIRPAGAVILVLNVVGHADPDYQAMAGVLAGVAGLTFHLAKSAARLLINNNPGPAMNILASIGEDLLVTGLFTLAVYNPPAGLVVCLTLLGILWLMFPLMSRVARASLFLLWKKVRLPAGLMADRVKLSGRVSAGEDILIHGELPGSCTVEWAVRCISGRGRHYPELKSNLFGLLAAVKEYPESLVFLSRRWFRQRPLKIPLSGCEVQHESGFLSEDVVIYHKAEKRQIAFRFTRAEEALASRLEAELRNQRKRVKSPPPEVEQGPLEFIGIREQTPLAADVFLPTVIVEPVIHEAPVITPMPAAPETPSFQPAPISPFPASTEEVPPVPAMPSLTHLPLSADVPPMPEMDKKVDHSTVP